MTSIVQRRSDADYRRESVSVRFGVVFTYADQSFTILIKYAISKSKITFRGKRGRAGLRFDHVQSLIAEVREVDDPVRSGVGASPILVNSGTSIERFGSDVGNLPVRAPLDNNASSSFCRAQFCPVHFIVIDGDWSTKPDSLADNQLSRDG